MSDPKYRLLKDIVIPAGTVFECVDGRVSRLVSGNYSHTIGLTKDSSGELVYGIDDLDPSIRDWFEEVR